jgi:hypothetical protein
MTVYKAAVGGTANGGTDTLFSIEHVIGTSNNDTFSYVQFDTVPQTLVLDGGAGNDSYDLVANSNVSTPGLVEIKDSGGIDSLDIRASAYNYVKGEVVSVGGVNVFDLEVSVLGGGSFDPYFTVQIDNGTNIDQIWLNFGAMLGSSLVNYFDASPSPVAIGDLYGDVMDYLFNTGTSGTVPIYDQNGNIVGQEINPSIGGSPISSAIADVIDHPLVVTSFSETNNGGNYTSNASLQTYEKEFVFLSSIDEGDVRLTASGT